MAQVRRRKCERRKPLEAGGDGPRKQEQNLSGRNPGHYGSGETGNVGQHCTVCQISRRQGPGGEPESATAFPPSVREELAVAGAKQNVRMCAPDPCWSI